MTEKTVYVWKNVLSKPLKYTRIVGFDDSPQWSLCYDIPIRHNLTLHHADGHKIEISCDEFKVMEIENMTNREFFAAYPEKLTGDIWRNALKWVAEHYGDETADNMNIPQILDAYLDGQHVEPETTVTTTIEVTEIFKGIPSPSQVSGWHDDVCKMLKEKLGADHVQIGNLQRFERGSE